jgi:uncharacterized OB-fold protein
MAVTARRLPQPQISPSPDAAPFWDACARRELVLPFCGACARFFFYPRSACPQCGSRDVTWRAASGRGRLHSFCIQHQSAAPGFRDAVPFVTAIVELEEGPRMMTLLTEVEPDPAGIRCEMAVEVAFAELDDGAVLPVFRPRRGDRSERG